MLETPSELDELQALLDRSAARAGRFLRETFEMPDRSLDAERVVRLLRERVTLALAHVTVSGEPRVAPVNAVFVHGRFWIPTARYAARATQLVRHPAVSLSLWESGETAIIVHGRAAACGPADPAFAALTGFHRERWFTALVERGDGIYLRVDADRMYTWARDPSAI